MNYYIIQDMWDGLPRGRPYIVQSEPGSLRDLEVSTGCILDNEGDIIGLSDRLRVRVCRETATALVRQTTPWRCDCTICQGLRWDALTPYPLGHP